MITIILGITTSILILISIIIQTKMLIDLKKAEKRQKTLRMSIDSKSIHDSIDYLKKEQKKWYKSGIIST